jgi:hypothetical protein
MTVSPSLAAAVSGVTLALLGVAFAPACDDAASCPGRRCDATSDGTPFDLVQWCQTSGQCIRDGVTVPVCPDAGASPPPACAIGPVDGNETLTFPLGQLGPTLGGRRDLVVTYAACEYRDGEPPDFQDLQVLYDGAPAECQSANPCDPSETPTVMICRGVPSTVDFITISFSYSGAEGKTTLAVEMQDTTCSYFCG